MEKTQNELIKGLQDELKLVNQVAQDDKKRHDKQWSKLLQCFNELCVEMLKLTDKIKPQNIAETPER